VNGWDIIPILVLPLLGLALGVGTVMALFINRRTRRNFVAGKAGSDASCDCPLQPICPVRRPDCWLAVKSCNLLAVQTALGLHNPKPCLWRDGLAGDEKLFIAPPVNGWILVTGSRLPDPSDDVDACFRFVMRASRQLGQVQFFSVDRFRQHHAWVRAEAGKVVRAYAWAGKTLWQQGRLTAAEKELRLKCYDYTEAAERAPFGQPDAVAVNVDRVPLLAERWSLDPARIDERLLERAAGVAGDLPLRY
jgi:hypothetical protein